VRDFEHDVRDTDSKSGLWLLLGIVILGSAVQMLCVPRPGSAAPRETAAVATPDDSPAGQSATAGTSLRTYAWEESATRPAPGGAVKAEAPPAVVRPSATEPGRARMETRSGRRDAATPGTGAPVRPSAGRAAAGAEAVMPEAPRQDRDRQRAPEDPAADRDPDATTDDAPARTAPVVVLPQVIVPPPVTPPQADEDDGGAGPQPQQPDEVDPPADTFDGMSHDTEADDARIVVVGPASVRPRDFVTFTIAAENVKALAHAPIRLSFDADVLEYVSAEEGSLLKSGGAGTQFMAVPGETPGTLDIALSRTGSAAGIDGSGVLCTVTFLARGPGMSPIVTAGSRFMDAAARGMALRSDDAYVSVQ